MLIDIGQGLTPGRINMTGKQMLIFYDQNIIQRTDMCNVKRLEDNITYGMTLNIVLQQRITDPGTKSSKMDSISPNIEVII